MQRIIKSFLIVALMAVAVYSCKKGDVVSDFAANGTGTYLTLVKSNNQIIDYSQRNTSEVSITVKEYGQAVDKIVIYTTKGTVSLDRSKWKKVKEVPYNGETTLAVKATEIAAALGISVDALETGATYSLYNQAVTKSGEIHDAANTNSAYQGLPAYNMALTWQAVVICPFTGNMAGMYVVQQDDWADWAAGDIVEVMDGPGPNQINLSKVWPNPIYGTIVNPLVVNVNAATGAATVTSGVTFGNYGSYNAVTGTGSSGYVFSCTGQVLVSIRVTATGFGDQGSLKLYLKKQ
jgi:hypothetical protein